MESKLAAYQKPETLGTRGTQGVFDGTFVVQEKIDGSQISFGVIPDPIHPGMPPTLHIRSKGRALDLENPDKLFAPAVATIKQLWSEMKLKPYWIYRGEAVSSIRHNVLQYERTPKGGVILYDVEEGGDRLGQLGLELAAADLGLESVPVLHVGTEHPGTLFEGMMNRNSILGGPMEGIVIKNYGKQLSAKFVSAGFKEVAGHPGKTAKAGFDMDAIIASYRTNGRWNKAIQHLREDGKLTDSTKDIGPLVREIQADLLREEEANIKQVLFDKFFPTIQKESVRDFHVYYKSILSGDLPKLTEPSLSTTLNDEWKAANAGVAE